MTDLVPWVLGAGGVLVAVTALLLRLYNQAFGAGKDSQKVDDYESGSRESADFQESIAAGHNAGNATRNGGNVHTIDPNDRANSRKRKT